MLAATLLAATLLALKPPVSVVQFTRTAVLRSAAATAAGALAAAAQAAPPPEMLLREAAAQAAANEPKVLYTPPSVKGASTPDELALAQYLKKKGAKFYGAYWCPFCTKQRAMFGATGVRALPYVECAPDGFGAQRCPPEVTGYPAWEIDGKFFSGMKTLPQLQSLSGFDAAVVFPAPPPPPPPPAMPPGGFKQPAVTEPSTPEQVQLATHLKQSGAVFYGAYWCKYCRLHAGPTPHSHPSLPLLCPTAPPSLRALCTCAPLAPRTPTPLHHRASRLRTSAPLHLRTPAPPQRALFGTEGAAALPYVECAADGAGAQKCPPEVDGFPAWKVRSRARHVHSTHQHIPRTVLR